MKLRPLVEAIGLTLVISQAAYAAPNGKPFEALNQLIEDNATAIGENGESIQANAVAITTLSNELSALDGLLGDLTKDVGLINTRLGTVESVVSGHTTSINTLQVTVTANKEALSKLSGIVSDNKALLDGALAAIDTAETKLSKHNTAIKDLKEANADTQLTIDDIYGTDGTDGRIAQVEADIADLELDVKANSEALAPLYIDLQDLNSSLNSLYALIETNNTKIANYEADIPLVIATIADLTTQYDTFVDVIATATAAGSDNAGIALLYEQLATLQSDFDDQKPDTISQLEAIQTALGELATQTTLISDELHSQMLALVLLANSDSSSITALQLQVSTLSGTLTLLNSHYLDLQRRYTLLSDSFADEQMALEGLTQDIASLTPAIEGVPNSDAPPVASFIHVDTNTTDNNQLVHEVAQFFTDNKATGDPRYVYYAAHGGSRGVAYCIEDDRDIFAGVSQTSNTYSSGYKYPASYSVHYTIPSGSSWVERVLNYTRGNNHFRPLIVNLYLSHIAGRNEYTNLYNPSLGGYAQISLLARHGHTAANQQYNTYVNYAYLTADYGVQTTVEIRIGSTKIDTCF